MTDDTAIIRPVEVDSVADHDGNSLFMPFQYMHTDCFFLQLSKIAQHQSAHIRESEQIHHGLNAVNVNSGTTAGVYISQKELLRKCHIGIAQTAESSTDY